MLSKAERQYLADPVNTPTSYAYVLEHRIKKKLRQFYMLELPLILQHPNLTNFCNSLAENDKLRTGSEPATFTLPR